MLEKNQNKIISIFSIVVFILISLIFNINNYFYFVIVFLIYGFISRIFTKYSCFYVILFSLITAILVPINEIFTIYMIQIMGLIGCIVSKGYLFIKEKKVNDKIISKKITYIIPLLIFIIVQLFYTFFNQTSLFDLNISIIIFSLIFIYLIFIIFFSITNDTFKANVILCTLLFIYFCINQLKIYFTNEPLAYSDLKLAKEAGEVVIIVKGNIVESLLHIKEIIILFVDLLLLLVLSKKTSIKINNIKARLVLLLIPLILFYIVLFPNQRLNAFIENNVYNDSKIDNLSSLLEYYTSYGLIGGLYGDYISSIDYSEVLINDEDLEKLYSSVKNEENKASFKKPNIIVLFTESFWDITKQNTILFNVDPLKEYHELKEKAVVINTIAPTFGGKSANNEFEFLTGATLNYQSLGEVAYETYYNSDKSKNNPTIIRELNNNGYTTQILNAQRGKLYNCDEVYKKMNVAKVRHLGDELKYTVDDEYLTEQIIKRFESKKPEEKIFYMTLSMESHMPYEYKKYSKFDFNITTNLDKEVNELVTAYTQSIRDASLELKKVYDYISTLDEDTIIVFFGDHLPFLRTSDTYVYNLINEFNTGDRLLDNYIKYNTETLILSNYDIKYNDLTEMSPDLILTTIINNMDINISDYYKWVYSTRHILPASNTLISKDINGKLYSTADMPLIMTNINNKRKMVQQYLFK